MKILFQTQEEIQRIEVYNEYLHKIPDLLKQLEIVETMYQKALLEEDMLKEKDPENHSVSLYKERLTRIKKQCEERSLDIQQQCRLIFELRNQIEEKSSALQNLLPDSNSGKR